jgi:hypothetical protein
MTDLSSPVEFPGKLEVPALRLPRFRPGATLNSLILVFGRAMESAYVAPFCPSGRPSAGGLGNLDGRNPDW